MPKWTQAEADKLRTAIASGVKNLTLGDTAMAFHDLNAMRDLLDEMEKSIAEQAGGASPSRSILIQHSRGL